MCFGGMNPKRAKWADGSSGTPAEMATAAEGDDTYCGTYEINGARKTVIHPVGVVVEAPGDARRSICSSARCRVPSI
jgi:hypothetical protein